MITIMQNLNRFKNFLLEDSLVNLQLKGYLKSHRTLYMLLCICCCICCKTLLSAKQVINDKLQGSVVTYLRCGGVVINRIKKGLLLSL